MIEAVLFDLDGTLYDRDALAERLFQEQYDAFAAELGGLSRERFLADVRVMDEHGHGDKDAGFPRLVRAWGLGEALGPRLVEHFWASYDGLCVLPADTRWTLEQLRRRRLKLGVITNGQSVRQRRKLAALGLADAFDTVLVSGEEGINKPDPAIFERALARCGVPAAAAMFVGDHPVADVGGARGAGLTAVWKHVPYWPPVVADAHVIERLAEVVALVDAT